MTENRQSGVLEGVSRLTMSGYRRLMRDRPPKAMGDAVNYRKANSEPPCATCLHFYSSRAAQRSVCEIMRPDGDASVKPGWTCDYHTTDGKMYPLLAKGGET